MDLIAAFGAVLGKQSLHQLSRVRFSHLSDEERGHERQIKFSGMTKWRFQTMMATLPNFLLAALILAAAGITLFMWHLSRLIGIVLLIGSVVPAAFHSVIFISSVIYPSSPYQNSTTVSLRFVLRWIRNLYFRSNSAKSGGCQPRWQQQQLEE